jgi:hypothetical protein
MKNPLPLSELISYAENFDASEYTNEDLLTLVGISLCIRSKSLDELKIRKHPV